MALTKTLTRRIFDAARDVIRRRDSLGLAGRFFHLRPVYQSPPAPSTPLADRIKGVIPMRIRLDGLVPPPPLPETSPELGLTTAEVRKVAAAAEMEVVRSRLRMMPATCVVYRDFVEKCKETVGTERGKSVAEAMDAAGHVVVLGDVVFLRPESIARAIESIIPPSLSPHKSHQSQELKEMEHKKSLIDNRAETLVKRELWLGLGFLIVQTLGFMRLTFWELSWDVMEPICFYVTSLYFMAGYAFFLRTSKDPSFEGFFESRFSAKQKKLMKAHNFDVAKYNELRGSAIAGLPSLLYKSSRSVGVNSSVSSSVGV